MSTSAPLLSAAPGSCRAESASSSLAWLMAASGLRIWCAMLATSRPIAASFSCCTCSAMRSQLSIWTSTVSRISLRSSASSSCDQAMASFCAMARRRRAAASGESSFQAAVSSCDGTVRPCASVERKPASPGSTKRSRSRVCCMVPSASAVPVAIGSNCRMRGTSSLLRSQSRSISISGCRRGMRRRSNSTASVPPPLPCSAEAPSRRE
ncbi:hypothetical protein D9M68_770430 [compost metagenome]